MENKDTNTDYQKIIRRANVRNYRNYNQNHFFYVLKLVSALFFIKFLFVHQMMALQKLGKMFFISSKKFCSFSRCSNFCTFSLSFPHFPDSKEQIEME